jgi:hypothetical protein
MRDAVLARLQRPRWDVQEAGYGEAAALSVPTTTTTFAEPASAETASSMGRTDAPLSERETASASALWPPVYCTTVDWLAPAGRPPTALACE